MPGAAEPVVDVPGAADARAAAPASAACGPVRADAGEDAPAAGWRTQRAIGYGESERQHARDSRSLRLKVVTSIVVLVVLGYASLGVMGAAGGTDYIYCTAYQLYTPAEVARVLYLHVYNFLGGTLHLWSAHPTSWLIENAPGYWAVPGRAGVIGITLLCACLLSVAGMLYQNVFKNPIATPGMLGASSGVSLGMVLLVYLYGTAASGMTTLRYALCYACGAAVLVIVVAGGRLMSGRGRALDVVGMMLVGAAVSRALRMAVQFVTEYLMDEETYELYYSLSEMLSVDTSGIAWLCLAVACVVSFTPVLVVRFKLNALAFDEQEVRQFGIDLTRLRLLALVCGAIMMLAAQIHAGMITLVSLVVPFLARSWFGCEARQQLAGCLCIGPILLLVCRDIVDLIPFVGEGLAIGTAVSVLALPLFIVIMGRHMRGWD